MLSRNIIKRLPFSSCRLADAPRAGKPDPVGGEDADFEDAAGTLISESIVMLGW